jgi:hypothetical protein
MCGGVSGAKFLILVPFVPLLAGFIRNESLLVILTFTQNLWQLKCRGKINRLVTEKHIHSPSRTPFTVKKMDNWSFGVTKRPQPLTFPLPSHLGRIPFGHSK